MFYSIKLFIIISIIGTFSLTTVQISHTISIIWIVSNMPGKFLQGVKYEGR